MPKIFSFTGGEAPKIIPTMTIVEKSKANKQANITIRQYCSRGFCVGMVFSRNFVHRMNLEEHVPSLEGEGWIFSFLILNNACIQNITEFCCFWIIWNPLNTKKFVGKIEMWKEPHGCSANHLSKFHQGGLSAVGDFNDVQVPRYSQEELASCLQFYRKRGLLSKGTIQ